MPSPVKTLSRTKRSEDARHLMRYLRSKANISAEQQAKAENVSVKTIKESIKQMEIYEGKNSEGQLSLAVRDLIISAIPQAKETLNGLLTATTTYERKNLKTGHIEYTHEADKVTRLEALRVVKGMAEVMIPKGPAVALQVNQTNQTMATMGSAETVEERIRRLRSKQAEHNLLPPVTVAVPDYIDERRQSDGFEDEEDDED